MKKLIILILISLSIFAQDFKKVQKSPIIEHWEKGYNKEMLNFAKEAQKIWSKYKIDKELSEELKLTKERAEIDIAKAEIQKLFLEYIKQGKFREDYELRIKLESKNDKEEIKTKTNEKIQIQMK